MLTCAIMLDSLTEAYVQLVTLLIELQKMLSQSLPEACVATGHVDGWRIAGDPSCDRPVSEQIGDCGPTFQLQSVMCGLP